MGLFHVQKKLHERLVGFFGSLAHFAITHPRRVLLIAAVITLGAAPGVLRLKLRADGHALVSQNAPEVIYDKAIRARFDIQDQIVVLIHCEGTEGIFNPDTVQLVRDLTAEFRQMPEINPAHVTSLATDPSFHLRPNSLVHETLLEPPLKTREQLAELRNDLQRIKLYTGTLVSADGKSTAILIGAPPVVDRARLYKKIRNVIAAKQPRPEKLAVTGAPVAESLLGIHILEDLGVPRKLLGASTRTDDEASRWKSPSSFYELRLLIARRIGLVPVAMLAMIAIFFLTFRKIVATLLPLPEIAATLLFVFGVMGWLGVPIYLTIAVMPVLLTAMCVTDEIHVFSRYFTLLREKPGVPHVELVSETINEMVGPVANTTLTTAIGFVSFAFSPLKPVQAFGIFTAVGVLFSLVYSLTVIPAMLTLINPKQLVSQRKQPNRRKATPLAEWFARLGPAVVHNRYWALGGLIVAIVLLPFGVRRLVIQDSWIDGFDPSSEFRRATQLVNDQFFGMHLLLVSFEAPKSVTGKIPSSEVAPDKIVLPGNLVKDVAEVAGSAITISVPEKPSAGNDTNGAGRLFWQSHLEMVAREGDQIVARIAPRPAPANFWPELSQAGQADYTLVVRRHFQPEIIRTIASLGSFIRERRDDAVGGVLSPADYLETTRFMARPNDPDARRLPDEAEEVKLMWDYYGLARGPHRLRQVVDTNYWQSLTTVFLKDANFVDTGRLMADIRSYEREKLAPKGIKLGFAGDVAVSQSLIKGIVTTQLQSLFWSLVGIYLITAVLGRSLRWGVYCVLPSALAVAINFAAMGWLGIPLGVATSMFAGMTLGIGVDFAIHLLEGYEMARVNGASGMNAMSRAMALTGPPVLTNTLAVSFGFGVLMLSQVPANARLGMLVVLGLIDCLIASLLILPLLLHWWPLPTSRADQVRSPR